MRRGSTRRRRSKPPGLGWVARRATRRPGPTRPRRPREWSIFSFEYSPPFRVPMVRRREARRTGKMVVLHPSEKAGKRGAADAATGGQRRRPQAIETGAASNPRGGERREGRDSGSTVARPDADKRRTVRLTSRNRERGRRGQDRRRRTRRGQDRKTPVRARQVRSVPATWVSTVPGRWAETP